MLSERPNQQNQPGVSRRAAKGLQERHSMWFLAGQTGDGDTLRHIPLHTSPFRIGRRADLELCLPRPTISSLHAEILDKGHFLVIRDLGSTNGTYVNGQRIASEATLKPDDLLHVADVAFRVRLQVANYPNSTVHEDVCDQALALVQFDTLMSQRAVVPFFQPIITIGDGTTVGYEVLGRSRLVALETPKAMFQAASQLNMEVELSRMFRCEGIRASSSLPRPPHLFVNTHPAELAGEGLLESMDANRKINPDLKLTLEIHEAAVTSYHAMHELRAALRDLQIGLAYDDFGAGQTRLVELVEVPPDVLKFDMSLVRGIHTASASRQQMLATLVRMAHELGVIPLAEGIECVEEAATCQQLGFQLGQGFFYGKPAPLSLTFPQHDAPAPHEADAV